MKKQDKKIIDDVDFLSQLMEKNNLKELEISDGKISYKLILITFLPNLLLLKLFISFINLENFTSS